MTSYQNTPRDDAAVRARAKANGVPSGLPADPPRPMVVCVNEGHAGHNGPCGEWITNGWTSHGCHCDGHSSESELRAMYGDR